MGLTLTSDDKGTKIYVKDVNWSQGTFQTYSMSVASKDKSGAWVNGYVDCQFKKADASRITNKCKIKINNAFPVVNESGGKKYVKWFINDFDVLEEGISSQGNDVFVNLGGSDVPDFMKIDDSIVEEMPFK